MPTSQRSVAVFDLGGVLIDWNPRYLYRKLFDGDDQAMEGFLSTVCTPSWNEEQDAGRTFADATAALKAVHPEYAGMIDAWLPGYEQMLAGPIAGTVEILRELRSRSVPVFALSNWSLETFPIALKRFDFLQWFRGILISGQVRLLKPDRRIFEHCFKTFGIEPDNAVYIDDLQRNVEAATALGMRGIQFTEPGALRSELVKAGLIPTQMPP
jgi:2-haloacid dehalogenase